MEAKAPAIKNTELMESVLAQLGEGGSLAGYLFAQVKEEDPLDKIYVFTCEDIVKASGTQPATDSDAAQAAEDAVRKCMRFFKQTRACPDGTEHTIIYPGLFDHVRIGYDDGKVEIQLSRSLMSELRKEAK